MTDQDLYYASQEDIDFFNRCISGLPEDRGYSCGAHSVHGFREIVEIVKPKTIFEIGFNVGRSAAMWLELTKAKIFTIDISDKEETIRAAGILEFQYVDRFEFLNIDSRFLQMYGTFPKDKYDMAFIDGSHMEDDVTNDIQLCLDAGIQWLVMDDWLPRFGPGVQVSVAKFPLEVVKIWGNTALVKAI